MKSSTDLGMNRTGLTAAPLLSRQMLRSSHDELARPPRNGEDERQVRLTYAQEAPPLGTVPPPMSLKGMATTAAKALAGDRANVLVDKLAERLAFERMGVRLYDGLLLKLEARGRVPAGPSREDLADIQADERRHFALVHGAIESLGADPTVQTPSADLEGVAGLGLIQIIGDPRTDLREGLQAVLHAELADNAGWELLISLVEGFDKPQLQAAFEEALRAEESHLARVRGWVTAMTHAEAFSGGRTSRAAAPRARSTPQRKTKPTRDVQKPREKTARPSRPSARAGNTKRPKRRA
jgi:rubrerythrin